VKETFLNAAPTFNKDVSNVNPLTQRENPNSFLNVASQTQKDILSDTKSRAVNLLNVSNDPNSSRIDRGVAAGSTVLGGINAAFSIVTAPLAGLQTIPGVGNVVDQINRAFGVLGQGGANVASIAVDQMPISPQTKEKIRPMMEELGAITSQIIAGKAGADGYSKLTTKSQKVVEELQNDITRQIMVKDMTGENRIPVSTPNTRHKTYADEQGYEPYASPDQLPIIKMGAKRNDDGSLPSIQIGGKIKERINNSDYSYVPIAEPKVTPLVTEMKEFTSKTVPVKTVTDTKITSIETTPVAGTGEIRTRGSARSIEELAIEKKLTEKFEDLPQYQQLSMADQARKANEIIDLDYEQARRLAMGDELPPNGVLPESVQVAFESRLIKNGDVSGMLDLATKSKLVTEATTMGQRIRSLGERDIDSPVTAIQVVKKSREANAVKNVKGGDVKAARAKEVKQAREHVEKFAPNKQDWDVFVDSLTC
jgi:hypothetical protein